MNMPPDVYIQAPRPHPPQAMFSAAAALLTEGVWEDAEVSDSLQASSSELFSVVCEAPSPIILPT